MREDIHYITKPNTKHTDGPPKPVVLSVCPIDLAVYTNRQWGGGVIRLIRRVSFFQSLDFGIPP
jgi:hypothetical protein